MSAVVAGGLAGLILLGFLCERASKTGAYIGIAASLAFTAWATFDKFPFHGYMIGVIGHVVLFTVGYAASLVFPNRDAEAGRLTLSAWRRGVSSSLR